MFDRINRIHMVGIGGIGMSALAKYFVSIGKQVSGSDLHQTDIIDDLIKRRVAFHDLGKDAELLIYSPAVPETDSQRIRAQELGIPMLSYPQALGELSKQYSTIVVTGTHGKSTTTAMLGLILEAAGYDPTVIVGSLVPSFEMGNVRVGKGRFLVIEGCEHQANMLNLHPEMIVLTSIEADHLDYYQTLDNIRAAFQTFVDRLAGRGMVIANADDSVTRSLSLAHPVWYGQNPDVHYRFSGRQMREGVQEVRVERRVPPEALGTLSLQIPGLFNVSNALAATAAAMELGVPFETCTRTLARYTGIWRRFERLGEWNQAQLISDYGHHPTAIRVTLQAARELFPEKKMILCFQPHQHARTQTLFDEFVSALSEADALVLPEIYRVEGRTEEEEVSSKHLVDVLLAKQQKPWVCYAKDFDEAEALLESAVNEFPESVVIIQGAGNIDDLARKLMK